MFRISDSYTDHDITYSVVNFNIIETDQYGDYICRASNSMGTDEASVNVYGKYRYNFEF